MFEMIPTPTSGWAYTIAHFFTRRPIMVCDRLSREKLRLEITRTCTRFVPAFSRCDSTCEFSPNPNPSIDSFEDSVVALEETELPRGLNSTSRSQEIFTESDAISQLRRGKDKKVRSKTLLWTAMAVSSVDSDFLTSCALY